MKNLGKILLSAAMALTFMPVTQVHAVSASEELVSDKWQEISLSKKHSYALTVNEDSIVTLSHLTTGKLVDENDKAVDLLMTNFLVNSNGATKYLAYHLKAGKYYFTCGLNKDTKKKVYLHINTSSSIDNLPNKKTITIRAPKDVPVLYKYNVAKTYSYIRINNPAGHKGFTYDRAQISNVHYTDSDLLFKGTYYFFFTSRDKTSYKIKPTVQACKRTIKNNKAKKLSQAPLIKMNKVYYGYFPLLDESKADLYRFKVTRKGKITINPYDMGLFFVTPKKAKTFTYEMASFLGPVGRKITKKSTISVTPGTYYIVYGSSSWFYNYHFKVTFHK